LKELKSTFATDYAEASSVRENYGA